MAFLDMDIVGGGTDSKSKISALANCLRLLIDTRNGPYLAVAWTKYPDLVQGLDDYIFPLKEIARPAAFVQVTKHEYQSGGNFDLAKLEAKIQEKLNACAPLAMLQTWEQSCISAAADVVGELSQIASGPPASPREWRQEWEKEMLRLMFNCSRGYAGSKNVGDGSTAFSAFCHAMNPLVADRTELKIPNLVADVSVHSPQLLTEFSRQDCTPAARAHINSMLHCSSENPREPFAGSVYVPVQGSDLAGLFPELGQLVRGLLRQPPDSEQGKADTEAIRQESSPVLIEANTSCDHAQRKVLIPRLLGGLLMPVGLLALLKDPAKKDWPDYIWCLGPIWVQSPVTGRESEHLLIVDALFVTSSDFEKLQSQSAVFRIRSQAFAALQAWFASHAARPGMLLLQ